MIQRPSSQHKGLVSGNPLVVVMFHPLDGVLAGLTLGESGVMGFAVVVQHHRLQRILHPAYRYTLM